MVRTKTWPHLRPSATGERPTPIPHLSVVDLGQVCAVPLDEESIILVPTEGYAFNEQGEIPDDPDAECFRTHMSRCWQATIAYERFGQNKHPNLLPFLRRDLWTAFPVIETPPGKPLCKFIEEKKDTMYSTPLDTLSTRVLPKYRPVVYKWALDLISALSFIHSEDIVFGNLGQENCWISTEQINPASPQPSLSVFGFVDARFNNKPEEESIDARESRGFIGWMPGSGRYKYPGSWDYSPYYYWSIRKRDYNPTKQTDLYLYGCMLYELMLGIGSGTPFQVAQKIIGKEWPTLETEYMGDIVLKCWKEEFTSADEVKVEVERFMQTYRDRDLL